MRFSRSRDGPSSAQRSATSWACSAPPSRKSGFGSPRSRTSTPSISAATSRQNRRGGPPLGQAPAERLQGPALLPIRRASPVLSTLFLKGIDIKSARKFTAAEIDFAQSDRDPFRHDVGPAARLPPGEAQRQDRPSGAPSADAQVAEGRAARPRAARPHRRPPNPRSQQAGPLGAVRAQMASRRAGDRAPAGLREKGSGAAPVHEGEWLNAYVYDIIDDQLVRHEVPYSSIPTCPTAPPRTSFERPANSMSSAASGTPSCAWNSRAAGWMPSAATSTTSSSARRRYEPCSARWARRDNSFPLLRRLMIP